jgi:hypothetical protein
MEALFQGTRRKKVQREAPAHALAGQHIFESVQIGENPRLKIFYFANLIGDYCHLLPYFESSQLLLDRGCNETCGVKQFQFPLKKILIRI